MHAGTVHGVGGGSEPPPSEVDVLVRVGVAAASDSGASGASGPPTVDDPFFMTGSEGGGGVLDGPRASEMDEADVGAPDAAPNPATLPVAWPTPPLPAHTSPSGIRFTDRVG